jgi:hypothetical protein
MKRKYKHKGELKRGIAKVKVCGFVYVSVIPLFFLWHPTVTGTLVSYLDVLEM